MGGVSFTTLIFFKEEKINYGRKEEKICEPNICKDKQSLIATSERTSDTLANK